MRTIVHMPVQPGLEPTRANRRARAAVAALFLTNGALFANLLPRYPEIKASLELENATYGLAVAAFPTGAIAAGLFAATLIRRFGSAPVAVIGTMPRTPMHSGSSAGTGVRSSTPSTPCGPSVPCSADRWPPVRSPWTFHWECTWVCPRRCSPLSP